MSSREDPLYWILGLVALLGLGYGLVAGQFLLGLFAFLGAVGLHLGIRLVRALERIAAALETGDPVDRRRSTTAGGDVGGRTDEDPAWDRGDDRPNRERDGEESVERERTD